MSLISVIVPVYRAEKYLNRCVDSILGQSYSNLEVLLIDDGSPDKSGEICDGYAQKDKRVRVLHKSNGGVVAARNSGLDLATGEYITFVDSDDYIEPDMYQSMMNTALKYDCDVVMCDCMKDFPNHSELYTHDIRPGYYNKTQLVQEYFPHLIMMENVEYPPTISNCLCLYRQREGQCSLNKRNENKPQAESNALGLRYIEGVRYSEDLLFGAQLIYQANSFYYMKGQAYYHYCMNPQSATHTFALDKWKDYKKIYKKTEKYFLGCPDFDFRHQIDLMLLFFVYNTVGDISGTSKLSKKEKIINIKKIINDKDVREIFRRILVIRLPVPMKLKLLTLCYKYKIGIKTLVKWSERKA